MCHDLCTLEVRGLFILAALADRAWDCCVLARRCTGRRAKSPTRFPVGVAKRTRSDLRHGLRCPIRMTGRQHRVFMKEWKRLSVRVLTVGIPVAVWGLWFCSGLEVLTKARKAVEIEVEDELFGDTVTETRMIPGPVGGYYIGLDLAVGITVGALLIGAGRWRRTRRRLQAQKPKGANREA